MTYWSFVRENARWLAGGFLMTFFSSYGQTFFISLSAGDIRSEYDLSHGQFGTLYMVATLASALTLSRLGAVTDRYSASAVNLMIVPVLAIACVGMAFSTSLWMLVVTIFLLRLFGQGMMSQNAFTAAGRWFAGQRGKAMSLTAIGVNAGEALFPLLFVLVAAAVGWRNSWLLAAATLLLVAAPLISGLVAQERQPRATDPVLRTGTSRDWTRGEVLRDPLFYLLLAGTMAPGFIGTTIFFHQVYLVELRGWSLELFASSFTLSAAMTVSFAFLSGFLIDKYSAVRMLPAFLVPLGLACIVLGTVGAQWSNFLFMGLLGISYGFQNTLTGALWPEVYGTRHLGAVRAMIVAFLVLSTAMGPGITGFLIDAGVSYPFQIFLMGVYCLGACVVMMLVSRRLERRRLSSPRPSDTRSG